MQAVFLDLDDLVARVLQVTQALQAGGVCLLGPSPASRVANELVGRRPEWMGRWGLLIDDRHAWMYCEPGPGTAAGSAGQILLRLSEGRYLVDTFDCESNTCRARESAQGNPLVVGFAHHTKPVLLWMRRTGGNEGK